MNAGPLSEFERFIRTSEDEKNPSGFFEDRRREDPKDLRTSPVSKNCLKTILLVVEVLMNLSKGKTGR
jgi:hypothetical protein